MLLHKINNVGGGGGTPRRAVCESMSMYLCTTAVFSDPYLLNPDQAKKNQSRKPLSPDSDPSCFVTLPGPAASDYVSKKSYYTVHRSLS